MRVKINKDYNLKELLNIQKIIDSLTDEEYAPLVEFWNNMIVDVENRVNVTPIYTIEKTEEPFYKSKFTC